MLKARFYEQHSVFLHRMFALRLSIVILFLLPQTQFSQNNKQHYYHNNGWLMYFGNHAFSKHIGLHAEVQWRRHNIVLEPQQLLLRGGINFYSGQNSFFTLGYAYIETYPYGELPSPITFPEHRVWQQFQTKLMLKRIEMISRFRLEQRYVHAPTINIHTGKFETGDGVYTNRFRLLTRFSLPINKKEIVDYTFYISAYDELFVNFGKNVAQNIFDQNRAYFALGYKVPVVGRVELGYLYQTIIKRDGIKIENNHTLQVSISNNLSFKKKSG